jgi:hypothetical protein
MNDPRCKQTVSQRNFYLKAVASHGELIPLVGLIFQRIKSHITYDEFVAIPETVQGEIKIPGATSGDYGFSDKHLFE